MTSFNSHVLIARDISAVFANGDKGLRALERVSFSVDPQQFVCVLGPSGSGKSTLLRILAGLLLPTKGKVIFEGDDLTGPRREIGIVFQKANLMPWRSVLENVHLPLELMEIPRAEIKTRAQALVDLVGLDGFEHWLPRDLSGGMAQRVAIARALVHDPDVLLLDEPFGALDALTRERMSVELRRIWQARRKTVVMVTHDISEALFLADRVLVLSPRPGKVLLDLSVNLERPRDEDIRYSEAFVNLSRQLRAAIKEDTVNR
ncbi:MAG: ABC transporter ATP-binding protein [Anaerolineales bacterium]|jgi:NitT/TauT family transport system ATP-binding protein